MANTIASRVYRDKYRQSVLEESLKRALIAEAICEVDRSDSKRILNPFGSDPVATMGAITGNYTVADYQTTDDILNVDNQIIAAEHIHDFEEILTNFNLFANRTNEQMFAVADKIDRFVLNSLTDDAGESYSTPAGGFSADNIPIIFSQLIAKVAGYADAYKGLFIVLEAGDIPGLIQKQVASGFSFADAALKNGFMTSYMGVDIYVTRPGVFVNGDIGTRTFANSGHRVFGVKGVATYASPRGIRFEEKAVSLKTGMEVVTHALCGFKLWTPKANLVVDITITP